MDWCSRVIWKKKSVIVSNRKTSFNVGCTVRSSKLLQWTSLPHLKYLRLLHTIEQVLKLSSLWQALNGSEKKWVLQKQKTIVLNTCSKPWVKVTKSLWKKTKNLSTNSLASKVSSLMQRFNNTIKLNRKIRLLLSLLTQLRQAHLNQNLNNNLLNKSHQR